MSTTTDIPAGSTHAELHWLIARMGERLAALIERIVTRDGSTEADVAFLRSQVPSGARRENDPVDDSPLRRAIDLCGAGELERDLLVLAAMPEAHQGYASILRSLHPEGRPRATIGLASQMCHADIPRLLSVMQSCRARAAGLLRIGGDGPASERDLSLGQGAWEALHAIDAWPDGLEPGVVLDIPHGLDQWLRADATCQATSRLEINAPCVIGVRSTDALVAGHRAAAMVTSIGRTWRAAGVSKNASHDSMFRFASLTTVAGHVPILVFDRADDQMSSLTWRADAALGPVIVCAQPGLPQVLTDLAHIGLWCDLLPLDALREMWEALLPELSTREHAAIASRFPLEPGFAAFVARDARDAAFHDRLTPAHVAESIRVRSAASSSVGVTVVRPQAVWDDLVLPAPKKSQLRDAADRQRCQDTVLAKWGFDPRRHGARGVRVLLSGPPGVGKTMSAEVLASELGGLDLMIVDLSRIVSKWIGETEQRLAQAFDAAERSRAVLVFDECEAVFTQRTEVSDARDRYANLETAYLLTRLERFEGLAVLSTNMRSAVDAAFLRRIEHVIEIGEPGPRERLALWERYLPPTAPIDDDVRIAELADQYAIVGGLIKNAAVAAAFLAAAEADRCAAAARITRRHLIEAIRREYEKSGIAFPGEPARRRARNGDQ